MDRLDDSRLSRMLLARIVSGARCHDRYLMTGRARPYWPAFYFTGENGPYGAKLAQTI